MQVEKENLSRSEKTDGRKPKETKEEKCFWREIRRNERKRERGRR